MRRQDKRKNIEQVNLMLENSYLKSKGLLKESEDAPFNDLKLNKKWEIVKLTLDNTTVDTEEFLKQIKNGKRSYGELTQEKRTELYNKAVEYLDTLKKEKTKTSDYLKQKQQQEKEGGEFKTQKTPKGVELKWMGDNYEIYFPNNEVEKQTLNFGTDLNFAKYVFNLVMEYENEKEENQEENQEEIYDTLDKIIPRLKSSFNKTMGQGN